MIEFFSNACIAGTPPPLTRLAHHTITVHVFPHLVSIIDNLGEQGLGFRV